MAMYGNGVPTGMAHTLQPLKPTLQALQQVRTALFVAAAGAAVPSIAVQPFASTAARPTKATVSGFVCLSPPSFYLVEC